MKVINKSINISIINIKCLFFQKRENVDGVYDDEIKEYTNMMDKVRIYIYI